ncbi:MAG: DinB family protein [Bacteroidota bacterium]
MQAVQLIDDLVERTKDNLNRAQLLKTQPESTLNYKPKAECWSALECLEHLNRYSDFYVPEMRQRMKASTATAADTFTSGWLGDKLAKSLLPQSQGGAQKMNSPKKMNPKGSQLDKSVVDTFIRYQYGLLDLLKEARQKNLSTIKTGITLTQLIKLRLGDTFRVVIYHTQRHLGQAERAVKQYQMAQPS